MIQAGRHLNLMKSEPGQRGDRKKGSAGRTSVAQPHSGLGPGAASISSISSAASVVSAFDGQGVRARREALALQEVVVRAINRFSDYSTDFITCA
jgi:hypothetical protein